MTSPREPPIPSPISLRTEHRSDSYTRSHFLEHTSDDSRPLIGIGDAAGSHTQSHAPAIPLTPVGHTVSATHRQIDEPTSGTSQDNPKLRNSLHSSAKLLGSDASVKNSDESNIKTGLSKSQTNVFYASKPAWSSALLAWLTEIIWCFVSIGSVVALVVVLSVFDDEQLPQWPLGLTLNTLVAFLATLARAAFVIPVSESLSQLKWVWFRRPRMLKDFQDFDAASRGVWGSLLLLKTTRGWSPSFVSALVLVSAILTSTLTQSAVTYPVRMAPNNSPEQATVSRSTYYFYNSAGTHNNLIYRQSVDQHLFEGLSYDYAKTYPLNKARCPTSDCKWQTYSSLSVCARYWNVTDYLNITSQRVNTAAPIPVFASLKNGPRANLTQPHFGLVSLTGMADTISALSEPSYNPELSIYNMTFIYSLRKGTTDIDMLGAMEVEMYFCINSFNLSFTGNIEERKLIQTTTDFETGNYTLPDGRGPFPLSALRDPLDRETKFPLGPTGVITQSLVNALNGTYIDLASEASTLGLAPARYLTALQSQIQPNVSNAMHVETAIRNVTDNIATSMSNKIAQDSTNVTGQVLAAETFVQVRWPWIAVISAQIALSAAVLVFTIVQTQLSGVGVVKSSTLPTLVAIDTESKSTLESELVGRNNLGEAEDAKMKSELAWRLGLTERGWRLKT
ncbi:hypothetical protein CKAH01_00514 [Colletotrichum kahawae]|uniref:Uncharacterized protein n=1 Tax=Colletotrichum kahawae TaxID=34407 RepID=A0AAD9YV23_COLKA|nr:hypothetical protein CKAH01_00514 [Colletotrichum kahawae]